MRRLEPILLLFGWKAVGTRAEYRTALLDLCFAEGINYSHFVCQEDGGILFFVSLFTCRRLQRRCRELGIALKTEEGQGLPMLLYRLRHRLGLWLGVLCACLLVFWSGRFVWHIEVTGNSEMTEREVVEELRACGFGVGSYIPTLHTASLENRLLLASERISWASVFLDGTVARVEIIERVAPPEEASVTRPANLIAAADGQIESLELLRGNCVVSVGQAVRAGELLVSGIYDSAVMGFRYTRAAGRVWARTEREITVEIPLLDTEKQYFAPKTDEITLNFFNFSMKIFKSTGNIPHSCDIIEEERSCKLPSRYPLPVSLTVTSALPYEEVSCERGYEEALELAYLRLEEELSCLADDTLILEKNIQTTQTDTSLILCCRLCCIENVAVVSEFEVLE